MIIGLSYTLTGLLHFKGLANMNIKYRMEDINTLICKACQDFLSLIIRPDWQEKLFNTAKSEIAKKAAGKKNNAEKFIEAYEIMKDLNVVTDYSVTNMDVTIINAIVNNGVDSGIVPLVERSTKNALSTLVKDKNTASHSGKNEDSITLYRRGFIFLEHLRIFVQTVEKYECVNIKEGDRTSYRKRYIPEIENLLKTLDEERIELIQQKSKREKDIKLVLESETPNRTWVEVLETYMLDWRLHKDDTEYVAFVTEAAAAGIVQAYVSAVDYYYLIAKDYDMAEKYLSYLYQTKKYKENNRQYMLWLANIYLNNWSKQTGDDEAIINTLISEGYSIEKSADGKEYILCIETKQKSSTAKSTQKSVNSTTNNTVRKKDLTVGTISDSKKIRLGRVHSKNPDSSSTKEPSKKASPAIGKVSASKQMRLGRVHKKKTASSSNTEQS